MKSLLDLESASPCKIQHLTRHVSRKLYYCQAVGNCKRSGERGKRRTREQTSSSPAANVESSAQEGVPVANMYISVRRITCFAAREERGLRTAPVLPWSVARAGLLFESPQSSSSGSATVKSCQWTREGILLLLLTALPRVRSCRSLRSAGHEQISQRDRRGLGVGAHIALIACCAVLRYCLAAKRAAG